jgi:hypothetical protein
MSDVLANALAEVPPVLVAPPAVVVSGLLSVVVGAGAPVELFPDPEDEGVLVPQAAAPRPAATMPPVTAASRISCRRLTWLSMVYRNSFAVGQVTIAESIAGRL